jgi:hypothetical protein
MTEVRIPAAITVDETSGSARRYNDDDRNIR